MLRKLFTYIAVCTMLMLPALQAWSKTTDKAFTLVIDAGHGGRDYGAIGRITNEKTINLNIALEFGRLVENNCPDVKVVYTRKTDRFVALQRRAEIANSCHADLFVSIHTNALPKGRIAYGTETYTLGIARADENLEVAKRENAVITYEADYQTTYQGFDPNLPESYIIFELMQDKHMEQSVEMARAIQTQYTHHAGRRNKGVKQAGFLVLRATSMPSVLTEVGFISTPEEERYLNTREGVQKMARSLYRGFLSYRKSIQPAASASEPPAKAESAATAPTPQEPPAAAPAKKEVPPTPQEKAKTSASEHPMFQVQFLIANCELKAGHPQFKGLKPVQHYREGGMVKYTYGNTPHYNEIKKIKKSISGKFPDAFIVAFMGDRKINLQEAIKLSKKK